MVALALDEILDIVVATEPVELDSEDVRISRAFVIDERVTEVLDVDRALLAADPMFFDGSSTSIDDLQMEAAS